MSIGGSRVVTTTEGVTETGAAVLAGRQSANIDERTSILQVANGLSIPVMLDMHGSPAVFRGVIDEIERLAPPRRRTFVAHEVDSLIAWTKRYCTADTVVYVNRKAVEVVIDDVPASGLRGGSPRAHRGVLHLGLHPRLIVWLAACDRDLTVEQFSDVVEANIDDIADAAIPSMIRNLEIAEGTTWRRTVDAQGRIKLASESTQGGTPVPRSFKVAVPIWSIDTDDSDAEPIVFRLALKVSKGSATFRLTAHNLDELVGVRVDEMLAEMTAALDGDEADVPPVPVLAGVA